MAACQVIPHSLDSESGSTNNTEPWIYIELFQDRRQSEAETVDDYVDNDGWHKKQNSQKIT